MTIEYGTRVDAPIVAGSDDHDDIASAIGNQIRGNFQKFETIAERDAWTNKYKTRLFKTTAFVKSNADGDPQWFEWSGTKTDGTDGAWDVLPIAPIDSDAGLIPFYVMGDPSASGKATGITLVPPLQGFENPDNSTFNIEIKHGVIPPAPTPSYLAYLSDDVQIVGKDGTETQHKDGTLWFDNVRCPNGPFIAVDRNRKLFGIQEPDDKDPNVTGGTNFLIAARVALKGKAPDNGLVRLYLRKKDYLNTDLGIVEDVNGQIMSFERHYQAGQDLGVVELVGIVNAKGLKNFSVHVVDNFQSDMLNISGIGNGPSGIMIQALTDKGHTSDSLRQFEIDTKQVLKFKSEYLGSDRFNLSWITSQDIPVKRGNAGMGMTQTDGLHFYNTKPMKMGISNRAIQLSNAGSSLCYFSFGKVFSAEETVALHNRNITVTTQVVNPDNSFNVSLIVWTGNPNQYTKKIITGVSNMQPELEKGWRIDQTDFIGEMTDGSEQTLTSIFNVPEDAVNYGIIIYPTDSQNPCTLSLKELKVDVKEPFTAGIVYAPELAHEYHNYNSTRYAKFVQDNQGYASLRYTITSNNIPMPCGVFNKGGADISIDKKQNVINGSSATGGEGALKFNTIGSATISTELLVWPDSGLSRGEVGKVTLWYARINKNGVMSKIKDSELVANVIGGNNPAIYSMPKFTINVLPEDEIVLRAQASKDNIAFIECNNPSKPMLTTEITYEELQSNPYIAPDASSVYDSGVREQ